MTRPAVLAAAALLALAAAAPAQEPQPAGKGVPADGTEVFRWLLHSREVKPITEAEFNRRTRDQNFGDLIVIVLGQSQPGRNRFDPLAFGNWVLQGGGAVLVAADGYTLFGGFLPLNQRGARASISGSPVYTTDPTAGYAGQPGCPFAVPRTPPRGQADRPEWGLFAGLDRVATNSPSALTLPTTGGEFRAVLAGFPPSARQGFGFQDQNAPLPPGAVLAAGGSGPHPDTGRPYRLLAVADPNVFTNDLMVPIENVPPPDNLRFANRVVSFLVEEGAEDRRKACLFVENGRVVEGFEDLRDYLRPPGPPISLPGLGQLQEKFVEIGDEVVDKLQEKDAVHRNLLSGDEAVERHRVREVAGVLLGLAAGWAALLVVRRVWGARQPGNLPPPPPAGRPPPREGTRPAGVFDRRQKELLRRDDLTEPVRAAVREMFREAGAPADAGDRLPGVRVSAEVRRPDTLLDALDELWAVGFGRPGRVTARRWAALEPLFVRAKKAHADGKWSFVWYEPA
ncbi:MAG: hypothetical protein K2X82_09475 [Gemmataceae bacterium]|nr:hypothetical protein [Gemmataceae bacterium]